MAAGTAFLKAVEHFTEPEKRLFEDPYSYHFLPPGQKPVQQKATAIQQWLQQ